MNNPTNRMRTLFRVGLAVYTMALLTATHWPGLTIKGPVSRTDLVIHAGVFCVWTCLLFWSGFVGVGGRYRRSCLKRRLIWTGVAGVCFGAFDELTQPMFSRVADPLDVLADWFGVLVGCGVIWMMVRMKRGYLG